MVDEILQARKYKYTRAERRKIANDLSKVFKYGDELEFMRFLRGLGIKDQDARFVQLLKSFRDARSGKI